MNKKIAIFDLDGVLVDFEGKLVKVLRKEFGSNAVLNRHLYSFEERFKEHPQILKRALELTADPNFYYGLEPDIGAIDFVNSLAYSREYSMIYLSSRPKAAETYTRRWLYNHTIEIEEMVLCGIKNKAAFIYNFVENPSFVVEDSPEQIRFLKQTFLNVPVYCWSQEWNQGIFPRLYARSDNTLMLWEDESIEAQPFWRTHELRA